MNKKEKLTKLTSSSIIKKLKSKGLEGISLEEMSFIINNPSFEKEYKSETKKDFPYKTRIIDRLHHMNYNQKYGNKIKIPLPTDSIETTKKLFFHLINKGNITTIDSFLKSNARYHDDLIISMDSNKKSALHLACRNSNFEMTSFLLKKGFNLHIRDKFLKTPLHYACEKGNIDIVKLLVSYKCDLRAKDLHERSCLLYSISSSSSLILSFLLSLDRSLLLYKDDFQRTALHYLSWIDTEETLPMFNLLISYGININSTDLDGLSSLHYASEAGRTKIIPALIKNGINLKIKEKRTGRTALEVALNEYTRQVILAHADNDYITSVEDMLRMKVEGLGLRFDQVKDEENIMENMKKVEVFKKGRQINQKDMKKNGRIGKERVDCNEDDRNDVDNCRNNQNNQRLYEFIREIQEYGINNNKHKDNPEIYNGSWVEEVKSISDLNNKLSKMTKQEAILSMMSLLNPVNMTKNQSRSKENKENQFKFNFIYEDHEEGKEKIRKNEENQEENKKKEKEIEEKIEKMIENKLKIIKKEKEQSQEKLIEQQVNEVNKKIELLQKRVEINDKEIQNQYEEDLYYTKMINELYEKIEKIEKNPVDNEKNMNNTNNIYKIYSKPQTNDLTISLNLDKYKIIYIFKLLLSNIDKKYSSISDLLEKYDSNYDFHILKTDFSRLLTDISFPISSRHIIYQFFRFDLLSKVSIKEMAQRINDVEQESTNKINEILFKISRILIGRGMNIDNINETISKIYDFHENTTKNTGKYIDFHELHQIFNDELRLMLTEEELQVVFYSFYHEGSNRNDEVCLLDSVIKEIVMRIHILDELFYMKSSNNEDRDKDDYHDRIDNTGKSCLNDNDDEVFNKDISNSENSHYKENEENVNDENDNIGSNYNDDNCFDDNKNEDEGENEGEYYDKNDNIDNQIDNNNENNYDNNNDYDNINDNYYDNNHDNSIKTSEKSINNIIKEIKNKSETPSETKENQSKEQETPKKETKTFISEQETPNKTKAKQEKKPNTKTNTNTNPKQKQKLTPSTILKSKKINGELKIQIKSVNNLNLTYKPSKSNLLFLFLNLKIEDISNYKSNLGLNSKEIQYDFEEKYKNKQSSSSLLMKNIKFNWAARIPLINKTLYDIGSFISLSLLLKEVNSLKESQSEMKLGDTKVNWTTALNDENVNKFSINDQFDLRNKRQAVIGKIDVMVKFISAGSNESFFDVDGNEIKHE